MKYTAKITPNVSPQELQNAKIGILLKLRSGNARDETELTNYSLLKTQLTGPHLWLRNLNDSEEVIKYNNPFRCSKEAVDKALHAMTTLKAPLVVAKSNGPGTDYKITKAGERYLIQKIAEREIVLDEKSETIKERPQAIFAPSAAKKSRGR